MKQIVEQLLQQALIKLKQTGVIASNIDVQIKVNNAKKKHGDFATNLAMMLARPCKQSPLKLAKLIVAALESNTAIEQVEIAEPGFINFFLRDTSKAQIITEIFNQKEQFGTSNIGQNAKIIIEYVSANPNGPLHVGHGRSAAFGATLANILQAAGYKVYKEYYVNDAGRQMNILTLSVWLRYLSLLGEKIILPPNAYQGDYIVDIARSMVSKYKNEFLCSWSEILARMGASKISSIEDEQEKYIDNLITCAKNILGEANFRLLHKNAVDCVLTDIKQDLFEFGVTFDNWFSEQTLFNDGAIDLAIQALKDSGQTYEQNGALWFRATYFGDEKDRVIIRANGQVTYFASDVAYHWTKFARGFERVIDIFGSDHHGYINRIKASVQALGHDAAAVDVLLVQFAILYRGNQRVQMSTRSGSFVTLRQLRQEVGNDVARFFYVMRKIEQHVDFDLDLAKAESNENPVYYIQYAHARICSVLNQLQARGLNFNQEIGLANIHLLKDDHEVTLIALLTRYQDVLITAACHYEPHQLAYYLRELAAGLHNYYNAILLLCESELLRNARLCLLIAVRQVLRNGLQLIGVSTPEYM